ncbi:Uncharacterized protein GBIM_02888 [Gryllus bimaculatus]|nr:Uncharacterized protein GBIM_02888 [Gryllus bimaculatus]
MRAELHYTANSTQSTLEVKKLQVADEAVYKCEITYIEVRDGCSVVQFINLTALSKTMECGAVRRGTENKVVRNEVGKPKRRNAVRGRQSDARLGRQCDARSYRDGKAVRSGTEEAK